MSQTQLVVGAGEVGTAIARLLADDEHTRVVLVSRRGRGPDHPRIDRVAADAGDRQALVAAAPHATVVYNCANPAYHRWQRDWPPIADALLAYAAATGAVLATVSNLYGYGPVGVPMTEDLPLAATGAKAQVRVRMWQQALAAHRAGRLRMTEVRGSDYLCAGATSLFGDRVVPRVLAGQRVHLVGDPDQPHTWTAPIDVARTLIAAAGDERGWGRAWHVPSNPPRSQREVVGDIAAQAGRPTPRISRVPPIVLRAAGLVVPVVRELRETDYQRERPYVLDDTAARRTFGIEPTPWPRLIADLVGHYAGRRSGSRRTPPVA